MSETLKNIIDNYRSGLLSTPNIRVIEKKFSDETIEFPSRRLVNNSIFSAAIFQNSDLINMKFINLYCGSSYFKKCLVENCSFENISFREAEFEDCVFKNCRFINCDFTDFTATETIFNECTFLENWFDVADFDLCHFLNPIFDSLDGADIIDSTFSNSKKSIRFEGELGFRDICDQINKLYMEDSEV